MKKHFISIAILILLYLIPCCVVYIYNDLTTGYHLNPQNNVEPKYVYDINTITSEQLQQIRGIGPVTAQRIIEYRESCGGFTSLEQLYEIEGLGPATIATLVQFVTVGG